MIVQLNPEQISNNWSIIKDAVDASTVAPFNYREDMLIASLMSGYMACWVMVDEANQLRGIFLTCILHKIASDDKELCIQGVKSLIKGRIPNAEWKEVLAALVDYARSKGCARVVAYSNNPRIKQICKLSNWKQMDYFYMEV